MAKNMNKTPDQLIQQFIDEQGKPTVVKRKKPNKPKGAKPSTESGANVKTPKSKPSKQATSKQKQTKQDTFEQTRRSQDRAELSKLKADEETQQKFSEGEIAYNNIIDLIDSCDRQAQHEQANRVKQRLDEEIATYGRDAVMQTIADAFKQIEDIVKYIIQYYWDEGKVSQALLELEALIRGYIPDMEEAKQIAEEYERATYTDSNTFIPSSQEEYEELPEAWR